jgi:molybdopterin/thiamine biosynthesis adenylyltransferase
MKPQILDYTQALELQTANATTQIISHLDLYIDELFDIEYPAKKDSKTTQEVAAYQQQEVGENPNAWGAWVYYPWLNICLQIPPKNELRMLRTSRNRNLVTADEQAKLYDSTIFIAGMSVGSNIVEAMVASGIGSRFILADMDIIETSNLNRIRSPLHHIGLHKVEAISRKVWELDPYIEIVQLTDGVNAENLETIFEDEAVTIVVDEMDNLAMKIAIREKAKQKSLPVIMAADDGDDSLVDIERYDLNPELELFSGLIPEGVLARIKEGNIGRQELGAMIGKYFVCADHIPLRMFESVAEVGKTLPSWPQLGGAAALSGVALAYAAKKIILGQTLREGRTLVSLDEKLTTPNPEDQAKLEMFKKMVNGDGNG